MGGVNLSSAYSGEVDTYFASLVWAAFDDKTTIIDAILASDSKRTNDIEAFEKLLEKACDEICFLKKDEEFEDSDKILDEKIFFSDNLSSQKTRFAKYIVDRYNSGYWLLSKDI